MWTAFNVIIISLIMKKVLVVLLSEEWWNKCRHLSCMRALYCLYLLPLQSCHHSAPWGHASASLWHHSTLWRHHKTVWLEGNTSGQRSSFIHKNKNFLTRNNQHGGQRGRGQGLSGGGEVEPWLEMGKVGGDSVFWADGGSEQLKAQFIKNTTLRRHHFLSPADLRPVGLCSVRLK